MPPGGIESLNADSPKGLDAVHVGEDRRSRRAEQGLHEQNKTLPAGIGELLARIAELEG